MLSLNLTRVCVGGELSVCKPITYLYSSTKILRISLKIYIFLIELLNFPSLTCRYFLFMTLEPVDYRKQIIARPELVEAREIKIKASVCRMSGAW